MTNVPVECHKWYKQKISAGSARSIVLYSHSQNGDTTRDCDGYLSMLTSYYCPPP